MNSTHNFQRIRYDLENQEDAAKNPKQVQMNDYRHLTQHYSKQS